MNRTCFITAYEVTRHYGGPEEGGWWYNWYEPIESIQIPKVYQRKNNRSYSYINSKEKALADKLSHLNEGNIYHSTGGVLVNVIRESKKLENRSIAQPYYC